MGQSVEVLNCRCDPGVFREGTNYKGIKWEGARPSEEEAGTTED